MNSAKREERELTATVPCMRCFSASGPAIMDSLLWLCASCAAAGPAHTCTEFTHVWYGHQNGCWVCLTCGAVMTSQQINTAPPAEPKFDYDC